METADVVTTWFERAEEGTKDVGHRIDDGFRESEQADVPDLTYRKVATPHPCGEESVSNRPPWLTLQGIHLSITEGTVLSLDGRNTLKQLRIAAPCATQLSLERCDSVQSLEIECPLVKRLVMKASCKVERNAAKREQLVMKLNYIPNYFSRKYCGSLVRHSNIYTF